MCVILIITGRKTGKGIFVYTPNTKTRDENVGAMDILKRYKTESPMPYVVLMQFYTGCFLMISSYVYIFNTVIFRTLPL